MQEQSVTSTSGGGRRRHIVAAVSIAAIVFLAIWIAYWWLHGRYYQSTDDAYVGGNVTVISPRISGYVSEISVEDNSFVHAGEPLLKLDSADFDARRRAADARVDAARATIGRLQAQVQLVQAEIAQAKAKQQASGAELTFARQDAARYAQLVASTAGTLQAAQQSHSRHDAAEAQYRAATSALRAQQQQLTVVRAQIAEATATLAQADAEAHEATLDVGYTVIRAPTDGYVGDRSAHVGTFVAAGSQLMSLVPAHGLWVDANFKEDQLERMRPGQSVSIVADVDTGAKISGHVLSLSPASGAVFSLIPAQNATGNFTKIVQRVPVRIALDGKFASVGTLRPGLSVTATVDTQEQGR